MLFLAGHETSATSFVWTLYLLATHKDEQEEVYLEIMHNRSSSVIQKQDLKRFKLLKNIFLGALRLYPPIPLMSRQAKQNDSLRGKPVSPKDGIIIAPWILHRLKDYWDNPNEFCPYRFSKGVPSERGSFLPFGMGSRMCIGMNFATKMRVC